MLGALEVREVEASDAGEIDRILHVVWEESLLRDVYARFVSSADHQVLVATQQGDVAGFVASFLTPTIPPRWEIDQLVVGPDWRGRGIGSCLLREALDCGTGRGAGLARASVRIGNLASQRAFGKAGFTTDETLRTLFVWDPLDTEEYCDDPARVQLFPADTLSYRGLWIEGLAEAGLDGDEQRQVIRAARGILSRDDRLNASAFVSAELEVTLSSELLSTARRHGEYNWWQHPLSR